MGGFVTHPTRAVLRERDRLSEARFHDLIVLGLARLSAANGRQAVADAMGRDLRSLENVFSGSDPKAKALFDTLLLDVTALDEVLGAYGLRALPLQQSHENDMHLAAGLSNSLSKLIESNADGCRDHNETLAVAALLRPHMGALNAIMAEADAIRAPSH